MPLRSFRKRGPVPLFARGPHYFCLCPLVAWCFLVALMELTGMVRALWYGAVGPFFVTSAMLAGVLAIAWVALRFGRLYETRHGVMIRRGGQWRVVPWSAVSGVSIPGYNDHSKVYFTDGTKPVRFVGNRRVGDRIEARIAAARGASPARSEPYR